MRRTRLLCAGSMVGLALLGFCGAVLGQTQRSATLSPQEQVAEGQVTGSTGELIAMEQGNERGLVVTLQEPTNEIAKVFDLDNSWATRTTVEGQTNNFYGDSSLTTTITFPGPPPAQSKLMVGQILNHMVLIWACDSEWVTLFPVGDPIALFADPAQPFLSAKARWRFKYGEPVSITVSQNSRHHEIQVDQGGTPDTMLIPKTIEHPETPTDNASIVGTGELHSAILFNAGSESFQGTLVDAATTISTAVEQSQSYRIGKIERISQSHLRLYLNP